MSKVLLLSSNTITEPYPAYPLGMAVVASALSSKGHTVKQFDLLAEKGSYERIGNAIRAFNPDVVGVSIRNIDNVDSFTAEEAWTLAQVKALTEIIRKVTGAPVVLGGPAFSIMPEEVLAYVGGDYGIVGEGGVLFNGLIGRLELGETAQTILRKEETALHEDMVLRPLWDKKLIKYYIKNNGVVGLHTKRGCPYNCIYCTYPALEGVSYRCREPESVIEDILQLKKDYHINSLFFTDSVFNDGEDYYLEIVEEILRREIHIEWSAFFQPRGIHGKNLRLLKRSGLCAVEAGTDASSDTTLQGLNKSFGFDDVVHFNDACVEEEIPCVHYVMFGGPGETDNTVREGLNNMASLKNCVVLAFSGIRIFPGTALHTLSIEKGIVGKGDALLRPVFYFSPEVDAAYMNEAIENSFRGRRDRVFPPSAFQAKLEVIYRFGHRGTPRGTSSFLFKNPVKKTDIMVSLDFRKVLLVHPLGYRADAASHDISRMANIMPPLGLASIAAYLEEKGIEGKIIDCYAKPQSGHLIEEYLRDARPAFIGFSCSTANFLDGLRIARIAKETLPDVKVIFGGHHVSALKEETLESFPVIDFGVVGEGEETMADLLEAGGEEASLIGGLLYREAGGGVCFTGYRSALLDLDTIPFPAYEKLAGYPEAYRLPIFNYPRTPNSSCTSSRGCPYRCTYCDRSVFPTGYRYNSAEYLYEHLRYLNERFGVRHVNFYDDQFTFHRKRVEAFTRMMIDRPLGMTFNCAVRAEHVDFELLQRLKAAGCWMISLGIENGDEGLLSQHRNNANLDLVADKIRLIKKAGILVKGLMMMGLPGETEKSVRKSMDYVFSLPIDYINVSKFTPFPGSALYKNIGSYGVFDEDWEKMDCMHFQFIPMGMTREELEELFTLFYRKHIMRLKGLCHYFTMIWRSPDSWIRFFSHLAAFLKFAWTNKRHA